MLANFLKSKQFVSALWVFGGFGSTQAIRLGSNLILTRLLAPEMFGVMALVSSIIVGVHLLSDVGIRDSVINNKNNSDRSFLVTAWTLHGLKGLFVFTMLCLIAFPMESYFQYENLAVLLMACAFSSIFSGFSSVKVFLLQKSLDFRYQTCTEIIASLASAAVMISVAYFYGTVWSLVCGVLTQAIVASVLSHIALPGPTIFSLGIEKEAAKDMIRYGKWVFLSTATMYIASHGDKVILATRISAAELGVYSIAAIFGYLFKEIVGNMSNKLLLPVYRNIIEEDGNLFRIFKARWAMLGFAFLGSFVLSFLGEYIIEVLYDERYSGSGWILQFLAFAGLCHSFDDTIRILLVANKDSFSGFCIQVSKSVVFLVLALSLSVDHGIMGILLAMALTPILIFPYVMFLVGKYGYRWWYFDIAVLVLVVLLFFVMWYLQNSYLWQQLMLLVS